MGYYVLLFLAWYKPSIRNGQYHPSIDDLLLEVAYHTVQPINLNQPSRTNISTLLSLEKPLAFAKT